MARIRIRIIFEGHFIRIFEYSNFRAHHCAREFICSKNLSLLVQDDKRMKMGRKALGYNGEWSPFGSSTAKKSWGCGLLGLGLETSLGTPFTIIPPCIFHTLSQGFYLNDWSCPVTQYCGVPNWSFTFSRGSQVDTRIQQGHILDGQNKQAIGTHEASFLGCSYFHSPGGD